ncbi:aminoglycoside phosphotransferase family protein [Promicromonospora sukumoe]|uniref:Aminoglycoside phosphotransferase (APT) family kinase protein n=1 Tax=Promicromonospora sukumoe TaxID=88382 RepID=A0A7W3JB83_9MICO|nr:aminoglycoside phosphotransferase family protein [Promicromonospora sukumoe]MBA8809620.1 aminoglycoside phosphotransferase (APT) family kinase protein [Promicromonospora sukumoe]
MTHTDLEIDADLIRDLLRDQHPDLAELPLELGARGWDNQLWRLGDDLAVRLPWATDSADELLRKEHAWVPALAAGLPLPVPVPQRLGEPAERFPRPWIVTTWVPGTPADREPATRGAEAARALGEFLTALHRPAPDDAPSGRGRGGPLAGYTPGLERQLAEAVERGLVADPEPVRAVWDDAVAAPGWADLPVWLHGDLHPANVLTADGTFCGVIDFGDLFAGDPAWDLAAAWLLLPDGGVDVFHDAYGHEADAATLRRARGVAVGRSLSGMLIGEAGVHGRPGGKATWGPPARAALDRLLATA